MLFPILALILAAVAARWSLGTGLAVAIAVGYFNGIVRANFLGIYSTFMFDAGMLGFYVGTYVRLRHQGQVRFPPGLTSRVVVLCVVAIVIALIPVNDLLVQLVALRGTVWLLPAVLFASLLTDRDLVVIARFLVPLNLIAAAAGFYLYFNGLEALYPKNAVTDLMYRSQLAAAGEMWSRIPATFLNAHSFGGTMMATLPLLVGALIARPRMWERIAFVAGIIAACIGLAMCGARQPAVTAVLTMVVAWMISGFPVKQGMVLGLVIAMSVWLVLSTPRFGRVLELQDTEHLYGRAYMSMNRSFLDLMAEYPMGAGMGSAIGTSVPSFLADRAPKQIGLENEYARILVDQGVIGLFLWLAFLIWVVWPPPTSSREGPWRLGVNLMFAYVLVCWGTAFIGTGMLASIPQSLLLMAQMGFLVGRRAAMSGMVQVRSVHGSVALSRAN